MLVSSLIFIFIALSTLLLLGLCLIGKPEFAAAAQSQVFSNRSGLMQSKQESAFEKLLVKIVPDLKNYIGKDQIVILAFSSLSFLVFFCLVFSPFLVGAQYSIILGIIIASAYILRLFYHLSSGFRQKVIAQLNRIFNTLKNHLSAGMTLDQAIVVSLNSQIQEPMASEIKDFVSLSGANIIRDFPSWLIYIKNTFCLDSLAKPAQLLLLELKHTRNQEQAFSYLSKSISAIVARNKKQSGIVNITLITMDFMTAFYLLVMFYVLPSLATDTTNWWISTERPFLIFLCSAALWLSYGIVVALMIWRRA